MLGPARNVVCSHCHSNVSVSWSSVVVLMVFMIPMISLVSSRQSGMSLFILILSLIPYSIVHFKFIPLVVRK